MLSSFRWVWFLLPLASLAAASSPEEDGSLASLIRQLDMGDWNARIHAVHELAYMQSSGLPGLAVAAEDGDWQVRMTAVHALGPMGAQAVPILKTLLKNEPCPVVRLMTMHNLGSLVAEGEEEQAMRWIFSASNAEVNACRDQAGPGRAPWAAHAIEARPAAPQAPVAPPYPAPAPPKPAGGGKSGFEAPTRDERYAELDALLFPEIYGRKEALGRPQPIGRPPALRPTADASIPASSRPGLRPGALKRNLGEREDLPRPDTLPPREQKGVSAPPLVVKDAGGKAAHDPIPGLLLALNQGEGDARARAADELGHLGARTAPVIAALLAALKDADPRVRSSASLALGNIGAGSKSVVPQLVRALNDENIDAGYAAALALSRIKTPQARRAFNKHVGKEARRAIEQSRR
jgi:hypothetical protein